MEEAKTKPTWRVLQHVSLDKLETQLNQLAGEGYQVFKLEPMPLLQHGATMDIRPSHNVDSEYFIVAFEPVLLGERMQEKMTSALLKQLANVPSQPAPGGPPPQSTPP